jgi:long-chain acyl-CoA synthetase
VQEYTSPTNVLVEAHENAADAVFTNAAEAPDTVVLARRVDGRWLDVTATAFRDEVVALAKGLVAAGVQPGDRVGLMSKTRYEWTLIDYAIWTAGAVTVPVYETSSSEQIAWNLGDSEAVAAFFESAGHLEQYAEVQADLPSLKNVWQIDGGGLDTVRDLGKGVPDTEIEERRHSRVADDLATIIYTSGTTGRPKGCEITHRNLVFDARSVQEGAQELMTPGEATLLFLPLAHVFARLIQVGCITARVKMGHFADIKNLQAEFPVFQPTFILSVPRVFEKIYNGAKQRAHSESPVKGKIFDFAEKTAIAYSQALDAGRVRPLLGLQHALMGKLVYSKFQAGLGGKVRYAVSGGAPLGARLGHFFRGVGVTILEGYGLSETTAGATINTPSHLKIGTVGRPLPGVGVKIAEDGEVLIKGDHVFAGYWRNPEATRDVLDDGWFRSGDIGELDDEGFLRITGRKKDLIVTAGGKNVAPAVIEDRLNAHPLISQSMVVGDQKPFVACLVTLDPEAIEQWKKTAGKPAGATLADLAGDADLRAEIQAAVDEANKAVSKAEAVRKFEILPVEWTEEGGQITPTLKLKRNVVMKEFAAEVEALYS